MNRQIKVSFYAEVPDKDYHFIESDLVDRGCDVIKEAFPELKFVDTFDVDDVKRTKEVVEYGSIRLKDKVQVTDPGYDPDVWCTYTIDMLPGEYVAYATIIDTGMLGRRVSELKIVHKDYINQKLEFKEISYDIGVDSGNCGFFDCEKFQAVKDAAKAVKEGIDPFTAKWWDVSDSRELGGIFEDWGVLSHSGYGDGSYVLSTARNNDNKVVAAIINYGVEEEKE